MGLPSPGSGAGIASIAGLTGWGEPGCETGSTAGVNKKESGGNEVRDNGTEKGTREGGNEVETGDEKGGNEVVAASQDSDGDGAGSLGSEEGGSAAGVGADALH